MTAAPTINATPVNAQKGRLRKGFLKGSELIGNVLRVALMIPVFVLMAVVALGAMNGYTVQTVLTGSMEPAIMTGERIISKDVTMDDIKVGDIITYEHGNISITHRVIEIREDGTATVKGDANGGPDATRIDDSNLKSKVVNVLRASDNEWVKLFVGDPQWRSAATFAAMNGDWVKLDQMKQDAPWGIITMILVTVFLVVLSIVNRFVRSTLPRNNA